MLAFISVVVWEGTSLKSPSSSSLSILSVQAFVFPCAASNKMSEETLCVAALSFKDIVT